MGAGEGTVWGLWERCEGKGGNGLRGSGGNGLGSGGWGGGGRDRVGGWGMVMGEGGNGFSMTFEPFRSHVPLLRPTAMCTRLGGIIKF